MVKKVLTVFTAFFVASAAFSWAADVTYTDKMGRVVIIPVPVMRAVIFQPNELIPVLGIWDRIVGIASHAYDDELMRATKPDIRQTIPAVGMGGDVNIESLLKTRPDLVITWSYKPEDVKFMEEKGLKVIAIHLDSLFELYEVMRLHGRLFGKEEKMERAVSRMEGIFDLIKQKVALIPDEKRKKVLWLYSKPVMVGCRLDLVNDIINIIGGVNPAAEISRWYSDVSMERIICWDPDVVFIWGNAGFAEEDIIGSLSYRHVRAVKDKAVYKTPRWSTWSPRLAPTVLWMAKKTYQEYFHDVDLDKVTDEFYREVFGIPYAAITKMKD